MKSLNFDWMSFRSSIALGDWDFADSWMTSCEMIRRLLVIVTMIPPIDRATFWFGEPISIMPFFSELMVCRQYSAAPIRVLD